MTAKRESSPTIIDAAIQALEGAGRPLNTHELVAQMEALGWKSRGDAYYTVFGALARAAKKEGSRLAKPGPGLWGLREWT